MKINNNYYSITVFKKLMKISQLTGGVVIVPKCADKLLLIKIKRVDGNFHWEFPRGFVEKRESHDEAVKREINEELGITDFKIVSNLGELMTDSGLIDSHVTSHLVNMGVLNHIHLQQSEKIVDYKLISYIDLLKLVQDGVIDDNFTLASLTKLFAFKGILNNLRH